jgi:hypothetical protein
VYLGSGAAQQRTGRLQDILRLLTLWFSHGSAPDVEAALLEGFALLPIDTWLVVIPQIIARIHTSNPQVGGWAGRLGGLCWVCCSCAQLAAAAAPSASLARPPPPPPPPPPP